MFPVGLKGTSNLVFPIGLKGGSTIQVFPKGFKGMYLAIRYLYDLTLGLREVCPLKFDGLVGKGNQLLVTQTV